MRRPLPFKGLNASRQVYESFRSFCHVHAHAGLHVPWGVPTVFISFHCVCASSKGVIFGVSFCFVFVRGFVVFVARADPLAYVYFYQYINSSLWHTFINICCSQCLLFMPNELWGIRGDGKVVVLVRVCRAGRMPSSGTFILAAIGGVYLFFVCGVLVTIVW
jgi:hypothetical protein